MAVTGQAHITASILAADFSRLGEQVEEAMNAGIRHIHVDVMDGLFVPNLSMGAVVVQALQPLRRKYAAELHVQLMIADPDRFIPAFVSAGADSIIVHVDIAVAGGILQSNAKVVVRAGAHILVSGSAIFNTQASVSENVQALVTAIRSA